MENEDKVKVVLDHREPKNIIENLEELGANIEIKQLETGDYITSEKTIIERKSKPDFEQSIIDQRLFRQIVKLKEYYENVIIIVEGNEPYLRIKRNAILGAYTSIITDFKCSLFFTRNKKTTCEMIYAIAKHEQFANKKMIKIYGKRKGRTLSEQQRGMIEALPKIGPQLAINLLENMGSVQNIANSNIKELTKIPGIGKKKANEIIKVAQSGYDVEQCEDETNQ